MEQDNSEAQSVELMLATMASAFDGCCRIFAPHYREAHILSLVIEETATQEPENAFKALDLAFTDVVKAFEHYLQHDNQGRPFILVGHSQGTLHGLRLLGSHIDGKALQSKLVAAYLVGFWLPQQAIEEDFSTIATCHTGQQTGCIVAYDSYEKGGSKNGKLPMWGNDKWGLNESEKSVCINPLTWTNTLDKVSKKNHLGALPLKFLRSTADLLLARNRGEKFTELNPLITQLSWAQCQEDGQLQIATQVENEFSDSINGENKSMLVIDFGLFYGNIRKNAINRSNAYLQKNTN